MGEIGEYCVVFIIISNPFN